MKAKYLLILFVFMSILLHAQETQQIYLLDGKEVTEADIKALDPTTIKSIEKGITEEEKALLANEFGDKVYDHFIIKVTLLSEEEIAKKNEISAAEQEKKKKEEEESYRKRVEATTLIHAGDRAPDFKVMMLDGKEITLSDLQGKIVLLNFWATWCPPCMKEFHEIPSVILDRFGEEENFVLLAISRGEQTEVVQKKMDQLKAKGIAFNVGLDPTKSIYELYAKETIPRNFLIDQKGRVVSISDGYSEEKLQKIADMIGELLK
jgi:peroxiredoxin